MMLNEKIREVRKAKSMTQEALAEAMGVSTASVSKWETGQSAPEIDMLVALADFFEVSVDALLGHEVKADRQKALLEEMEALAEESRFDEAREIGQKLLRNYPNDYDVVERVSHIYYRCCIVTGDKKAMEHSIELVHRLFSLMEDPSGMKRYELMSWLGNQYENVENWEMARKYYTESNIAGMNDRFLARMLANEKKTEEAMEAVSKVFSRGLYDLLWDVLLLEQVWAELGQPEKARAALNWGLVALQTAGPEVMKDYAVMGLAICIKLAEIARNAGDMPQAKAHIRCAMRLVCGKQESIGKHFLGSYHPELLVSNNVGSPELLLQMLSTLGVEEYLEAAREEMNTL